MAVFWDFATKLLMYEKEEGAPSDAGTPQITETGGGGASEPADVTQKGLTISLESDITLTPEQLAEMERAYDRMEKIKPILATLIPDITPEQAKERIAKKYDIPIDELDDDDRREARYLITDAESDMKRLVGTIAQTQIPDEQLEVYITGMATLGRELRPEGEGIDAGSIAFLVPYIQSQEHAALYTNLAKQWKDRFLTGVDPDTYSTRAREFISIIQTFEPTYSDTFQKKDDEQIIGMFDEYSKFYDLYTSFPEDVQNDNEVKHYVGRVRKATHDINNPDQTRQLGLLLQNALQHEDKEVREKFMDIVGMYGVGHELGERSSEGLLQKLMPALQKHDPQVEILNSGGNIWGVRSGDFGVGDFLMHAYASEVTPSTINELLMVAREIPTSSLARMEQNRIDALTLRTPFGILRDFVHDQRPYVHEVIHAMVRFYDTGDMRPLEEAIAKTDYFNSDERREVLADKMLYDEEVEPWTVERTDERVKPIDVLRRLDKNTEPIEDLPPDTSDQEFNRLMNEIAEAKSQGYVRKEALGEVMKYANEKLLAMMEKGEVGIEPNDIIALGWLEQRGFEVIQGLNYEDQQSAYTQEWFHEVLRFQELTASTQPFNEQEFQEFLKQVNSTDSATAYRIIFQRTLGNISKLTGKYKDQGRENRIGALWSGNIAHELIGLTDLRPASTEYGRRFREEQMLPEHERLRGD